MKQAILIGAYKKPELLKKLISLFPAEHFNIYIHLNIIGEIDVKKFRNELAHLDHVHVFSEYKIKWGGRNHLMSLIHLSGKALADPKNYFFHYITGQDLPVKPVDHFINEMDTTKDYIQTVTYPVSYLPKGATDWFEYYNFYDLLDAKNHLKYIRLIRHLQIKFGIKRSFDKPFPQKYYGSTYWSLTRETLQYVVDYTKNQPAFLKRLKHTFCAEELYFPTVVLNSPRAGNVVNDNLRFIKWEANGKTGSPKVLDDSDWAEIQASGKLFARKFEE
jgi:hypothetical protein